MNIRSMEIILEIKRLYNKDPQTFEAAAKKLKHPEMATLNRAVDRLIKIAKSPVSELSEVLEASK